MADRFDSEAFYSALNATRLSRRLTWKDVAEQACISASTLSRIGQGRRPDVDGLAALLAWSGLSVSSFTRDTQVVEPEPMAKISALLRADPRLSRADATMLEDIVTAAYARLRSD